MGYAAWPPGNKGSTDYHDLHATLVAPPTALGLVALAPMVTRQIPVAVLHTAHRRECNENFDPHSNSAGAWRTVDPKPVCCSDFRARLGAIQPRQPACVVRDHALGDSRACSGSLILDVNGTSSNATITATVVGSSVFQCAAMRASKPKKLAASRMACPNELCERHGQRDRGSSVLHGCSKVKRGTAVPEHPSATFAPAPLLLARSCFRAQYECTEIMKCAA